MKNLYNYTVDDNGIYSVIFNMDALTKDEINNIISVVGAIPAVRYKPLKRQWIMDKSGFRQLQEQLGDSCSEMVPTEQATKIDGEIGSYMKLKPYKYQQDVIRFALEKKQILIVAPCGSGNQILPAREYLTKFSG